MKVGLTTLPNGVRVVSQDMPGLESASIGVWIDAGARYETLEVNGIAHLLEHMAFKGTSRRSARHIAEEIEAVGGYLNAHTAREHTAYYAKVLKGDLPLAIDLLADILLHSTFEAAELERERSVVVQEIGQVQDTPDDLVFEIFQDTAFPRQALGRSILGTSERVSAFTRENLFDYLRRHYCAPRLVVAAAGRVDHDWLVAESENLFGGLAAVDGAVSEPANYQGGDIRLTRELEQVHFALGFPGIAYGDDDFDAHQLFSIILGGGMSSRLFQEVRERRGLAYSVFSFTSSYHDGGLFGVYAASGEAEAETLVPVICDEMLKATESIGDDELARGRAQIKAGFLMSLESSSARCEQLGRHVLVYGRPLGIDEVVQRIDAVDAAAVAAVARRIIGAGRPTVAALGPVARAMPYEGIVGRFGG